MDNRKRRPREGDVESMSEFLAMGGYGFYIWGAYLVTALVIAGELIALRARRHAAEALAADAARTKDAR